MDLATKDVQEKEPFALLMNAYCLHQRLGDDEAWAYLESAGWPDDKDIEEGWSGDSAIWSPSAIQQCLVSIKNKLFQKACWKELEWVCDVLRRLPKYNEWDMSGTEDAVTINENICTIITYQLQALQNQGLPIGKKLADQGDENDVKIALMVAEERFTQFNFADEATTKFLNAHINDITKDLNKHINAFPKNWENYKKLCELTSKLAQGLSYQCKYTDAKPLFTKAIAYARTNYDLITTNTYHLSAAARYANDDVDFLEVLKAWTEAIQKQLNAETPRKSVPQEKLGTPEYYTGMMKLLLDLKPHAVDYNLHYLLDVLLAALLRDCKPQETPWQECCQRICTMFNKAADNHTLSETDLKRHPYELIYKRLALLASYAGMETAGYIACLKESEEGESSIVKILRLANEYNLYARLQKSDKPSETTAMADCRERLCKLIQALPQDTVFDQDAYTAYCKAFAPYFDDSATVEQRTAILTYTYE